MCFVPQQRALFRHLDVQKWSKPVSFWHSWLLKVLRSWGVLYVLTSKCSSRHNGVQFWISYLASWLRTRRFSEPTFRPSRATNHWKNTVNRDFPTFSRACIFFLLSLRLIWSSHFFSSPPWLFTPLLFHLSILSEVWLLIFLRPLILFVACLTRKDHRSIYLLNPSSPINQLSSRSPGPLIAMSGPWRLTSKPRCGTPDLPNPTPRTPPRETKRRET